MAAMYRDTIETAMRYSLSPSLSAAAGVDFLLRNVGDLLRRVSLRLGIADA
jgi:hypothetical protein